ncbi:L-lactate permease [Fodinicola feengrottensis]|uniref:L-lactate permease n=1 Tax=Fodinicola feengrottensis TaxID=435914 RepID=A0ABP4S3V7_9ACTN|nr:L-lactate permease [Fodinicola feengrottensis]
MHHQILAPVVNSLVLSALVAAVPLILLLVLLGVVRMRSHWAALISLVCGLVVAIPIFRLPPVPAFSGALEGAAFGLFPIVWIIVNAIWLNRLITRSGHLDTVRRTFLLLSRDYRVQGLVVAFCFGSLLESMAGFGAPIAVVAAILLALGFSPIRAATVALFADAAGTAFGSVGNPIFALSKATGLPTGPLGEMVGRQALIVALFVPFALLLVLDGKRGLRQLWPVALATGLGFSIGQFAAANYVTFQLADLIGALLSAAAVAVLLRLWSPREILPPPNEKADEAPDEQRHWLPSFAPYGVLIVLLALVSLKNPVSDWLQTLTIQFRWPGAGAIGANGKALALPLFQLNLLTATGTVLLVTGLLTLAIQRIRARDAVREYGAGLVQVYSAAFTVLLVMALAYLMNYSGQANTIGTLLAHTGIAFALLSPVLGWLGVAATGSDTSANALFGAVQVAAAKQLHLSPYLTAAANSEAGALGKLISPQNLAIAAAAVGLSGEEGQLVRRTFLWSLGFLAGFCVLIFLMAYGPLAWLVVV